MMYAQKNARPRKDQKIRKLDTYGRRQPRPAPRRTGTRQGVIISALKEG